MIKAIFFDVDGTLLSHRTGRISPHTRACIRALRAGGTLVFLSTGRHILELDFSAHKGLYSRAACRWNPGVSVHRQAHSGAAEPPGGGDGV